MTILISFAARILRTPYAVRILILGFAGVVAMVRVATLAPITDPAVDQLVGKHVQIVGVLSNEVDERESQARLSIHVSTINDLEVSPRRVIVLASVAPHPQVAYGDTVTVDGVLKRPDVFETDVGRLFDYPGYLAVSGIGYTVSFAHVTASVPGAWSPRRALFALKERYLSGVGEALIEPYAALAGGLTVGDKRALGGELLETFRDAGIIHIVVLSGFNITVIVACILGLLRTWSARCQLVVGVCFVVGFVLMTGASATGVRAGIMAILALLATTLSRRYAIMRALAFAAVCMVLWNPRILLSDPGFQLSIVATVGLIVIAPHIARYCGWLTERFGFREIVASTLGTQIAVLPLLMYHVGTVSLIALLANVLVLPMVPLAMLFAASAGWYAMAGLPFAALFGYPAHILLAWIVQVAQWAASVPFAYITVPEMPLWVLLVAYALGALCVAHFQMLPADESMQRKVTH